MRARDEEMDRGRGEALKLLLQGRITAEQMKSVVEGAKHHDLIGPLIDTIRAGEPVACDIEQVEAYNSLQVFHAHRFVVDPAGKFDVVAEMIVQRQSSDRRESEYNI